MFIPFVFFVANKSSALSAFHFLFAMEITEKDVEHIASLAHLDFDEEAKVSLTANLKNILEYIKKLDELDTSKVEPTSHVLQVQNVFRDDSSKAVVDKESSFQNAPQFDKGHYRVPKIIESA